MEKHIDNFDNWWANGGQAIAENKYTEELEEKFNDKSYETEMANFYGTDKHNAFWYAMEDMARKDKLHLL